MKTKFKYRLLILGGVIVFLMAFAFWYKITYSMEIAEKQVVNSPNIETKILIATQGSDFKNAVVTDIINFFKNDTVHLNTIDVSKLQQIEPKDYDAIVILHTWEYGKAPEPVKRFITENMGIKEKMIVFASSGAGTNKIEGIDALAGESIIENTNEVSGLIISRIGKQLNQ